MMKKKDKEMDNQNVINFPGLKDRLLTIGLEYLDKHQYTEAVHFLRQANEMDQDNPEIGTAFLLALYESGDYENAKNQCNILLNKGIGDYFKIVDVLLMILIQLSEHEEVVHTITVLLDENEVPINKKEHYEKLLHFSQKRMNTNEFQDQMENEIVTTSPIFLNNDMTGRILKIAELTDKNIKPYMNELTSYLSDSASHPFIQSMVLNVLKEHGIEKEITVKKFHFEERIIPDNVNNVFETPFYLSFINIIKERLEHENPSLFDQIKVIIDRHFFLLYPFELSPDNPDLWGAAYICLGFELYGENVNLDSIAEQYEVDPSALEKALYFVHKLEEISLPIL